MGIFFHKPKPSLKDKAVLDLKVQRDNLKRLQKRLTDKLLEEKAKALELYQKKEIERAKFYVKKKICLEKRIGEADIQIEIVEKMISDLDFATIQSKVFDGLKLGNQCLKKIMDTIDIDLLEEFQDTTEEARMKNEEINRMLGSMFTDEDEDELEKELNQLMSQTIELPSIPLTLIPEVTSIQDTSEILQEKPAQLVL